MPKQPISVTLDEANLVWLRGLSERSGARSLSETLDRLITSARRSGSAETTAVRSVVGTIDLAADDPLLEHADEVIRDAFARSLSRPFLEKEARTRLALSRKSRG